MSGGDKVHANGRKIACKASSGYAVATVPDVCWSPPPPPLGPIPLPYPNTAFARDTTQGSKTVLICGIMVMKQRQSCFAKSTGDEPATEAFPKGINSHALTGSLHFASWSPDVRIEGKNADRHLDLTTHNHERQQPDMQLEASAGSGDAASGSPGPLGENPHVDPTLRFILGVEDAAKEDEEAPFKDPLGALQGVLEGKIVSLLARNKVVKAALIAERAIVDAGMVRDIMNSNVSNYQKGRLLYGLVDQVAPARKPSAKPTGGVAKQPAAGSGTPKPPQQVGGPHSGSAIGSSGPPASGPPSSGPPSSGPPSSGPPSSGPPPSGPPPSGPYVPNRAIPPTVPGLIADATAVEHGTPTAFGHVNLRPTIDRIKDGTRIGNNYKDNTGKKIHNNDGKAYKNWDQKLKLDDGAPAPAGYYTEYHVPTPQTPLTTSTAPGAMRLMVGKNGEIQLTTDHYASFRRID